MRFAFYGMRASSRAFPPLRLHISLTTTCECLSRASPRSYLTHHIQRIAFAAVRANAKHARWMISCFKTGNCKLLSLVLGSVVIICFIMEAYARVFKNKTPMQVLNFSSDVSAAA